MTQTARWMGLVGWVAVCFAASGLGAVATTSEIGTWYRALVKPAWNPPDAVFGPVWMTLYLLMAIAAWLIWRPAGFAAARVPLVLFALQLVLNGAWSWIFFRLHQMGWAVVEIGVLWVMIFATTVVFFKNNKLAGSLMVPYLVWVGFASVLNFTIWRLN